MEKERERERERVCVTGASGFIASWVVKLLLERGYIVNATVLSLKDATKTEYLMGMDGAKERLHFFEANLMEDASFDLAVHGCHGVFHIASPVLFHSPNPQIDVFDPAVKGTLNVLSSCTKCSSVRRVILTSSMAAVIHSSRSQASESEIVFDETWFSDPQLCTNIYMASKTLAEEAAWKFSKENGIDMVVINPGMVIGPMLQPILNATVATILKLINGSETYPNMTMSWVYVKDVATAHISAFETPSANGRYCLVESVASISEVVKMLQELYPSLPIPDMCVDHKPFPPTYQVSKEKAKNLGVEFVPLKVSLEKTVECLMQKEFVSF